MNLQSLQHICVGDRLVVHNFTYMLTSAPLYITHDTDRASMPIHCQLDSTRRLQKPLRVSKFEHAPREKGFKPMSLWAAMGLTRRHLPHMCHCLYSQCIAVHFACVTGAEANQAPCLWSAQSESPRLDMRLGAGWVGESLGASVSIGCSGTERSPDTIVLKRPCCCSAKSALSKHFLPLLCMHSSVFRLLYCFTSANLWLERQEKYHCDDRFPDTEVLRRPCNLQHGSCAVNALLATSPPASTQKTKCVCRGKVESQGLNGLL